MTIFAGGEAEYAIDDRPRRSLLLRARDVAGVALVAVNAVVWPFLLWVLL